MSDELDLNTDTYDHDEELRNGIAYGLLGCAEAHVKAHETLEQGKVSDCLLCEAWYTSKQIASDTQLDVCDPDCPKCAAYEAEQKATDKVLWDELFGRTPKSDQGDSLAA